MTESPDFLRATLHLSKRVARMLNIPELDPRKISRHSARIGVTQDLVEDGAPDAAIMRDTGWTTPRVVGMYSRGAKAKQGAMAERLMNMGAVLARLSPPHGDDDDGLGGK